MRSPAPPLRPRPAAFVLPHSLSQPVRSRQTEWQPLIGGCGAANQKGAPHVRARSFKRASRGARGGGRGGGPGRRAAPRGPDAQRGARGPLPQSVWDWPAGGFSAPSPLLARTSWGVFCLPSRFAVEARARGPAASRGCWEAALRTVVMRLRKACLLLLLLALAQLLAAASAGGPDEGELPGSGPGLMGRRDL